MRLRKAVIPAAGLGTRFLPATKTMPKEMLPVVDKPVLQFVVEEALESGVDDVLIVTGRGKRAIEDHFDASPELETFLDDSGRTAQAAELRGIGAGARFYYIRQKRPLGLGDAIRLAREHVGSEPFAVLLGDTIIDPPEGEGAGLFQLARAFEKVGASVVAVHEVPLEWVSRYGIVEGEPLPGEPDLIRLARLVEKPAPEKAPSRLAIAGRYVFTPGILEALELTGAGVGGEVQLTDAMNRLAQKEPVYALRWRARRYDIGNRLEYAKCFLDFALRRADTGDALREHLRSRLAGS